MKVTPSEQQLQSATKANKDVAKLMQEIVVSQQKLKDARASIQDERLRFKGPVDEMDDVYAKLLFQRGKFSQEIREERKKSEVMVKQFHILIAVEGILDKDQKAVEALNAQLIRREDLAKKH